MEMSEMDLFLYLTNAGLGGVVVKDRSYAIYSDSGTFLGRMDYTRPRDARRGCMRLVQRLKQNPQIEVKRASYLCSILPQVSSFKADFPAYIFSFDTDYCDA